MNRLLWFLAGMMIAFARPAVAQDLRGRLLATPLDSELRVTLTAGESVVGRLSSVGESSFVLRVLLKDEARGRYGLTSSGSIERTIRLEDVKEISDVGPGAPAELRRWIRPGQGARVTIAPGETIRGKVESFDGNVLTIEGRTWRLDDGEVTTIETRVSDSLLNGALIGAGIGAGLSLLSLSRCDCTSDEAFTAGALFMGITTGLGILFDAMTTTRKVFRFGKATDDGRFTVAPILRRDQVGLMVRLRF